MRRIKEEWDVRYNTKSITAQCLRDNAAGFKKDKAVMTLVEVREGQDVIEKDITREQEADNVDQERGDKENENNTGEE